MVRVLHRPLTSRQPRQAFRSGLLPAQTGQEHPCVLGRPTPFLVGGGVAGVEDLARPGKGQRVGLGCHHAQFPGFDATVATAGLDKRGVAPASFVSALWRTVGWLFLRPST